MVVNLVRRALLSDDTATALGDASLDTETVAATLTAAGLDPAAATALLDEGRGHLERQALQQSQRALLEDSPAATTELPLLDDVGLGGLMELADLLREGGVA